MSQETQIMFTVTDIASIFSVSEETVRRWIRSGKLKTTITSKKDGHKIAEKDLREFISITKPKYQKFLPFMRLSLMPIGAVPSFLAATSVPDLNSVIEVSIKQQLQSILSESTSQIVDKLKATLTDNKQ